MDSPVLRLKVWGQRKPSQALSPAKALLVPVGMYTHADTPAHGAALCVYQRLMLPLPKRVQDLSVAGSSLSPPPTPIDNLPSPRAVLFDVGYGTT